MILPTTREGYLGAIAWYIFRVRVTGEIVLPEPKGREWPPKKHYAWIQEKEVSEKDARKAARGNL